MYYLSNRTIELLAELGDKEAKAIKDNSMNYEFGFISKNGKIKFGPVFWLDYFNDKTKKDLRRLNKPTFRDTAVAWPIVRP